MSKKLGLSTDKGFHSNEENPAFNFTLDENGILRKGNNIIPQKKLLKTLNEYVNGNSSLTNGTEIYTDSNSLINRTIMVEVNDSPMIIKPRAETSCSVSRPTTYINDNVRVWIYLVTYSQSVYIQVYKETSLGVLEVDSNKGIYIGNIYEIIE